MNFYQFQIRDSKKQKIVELREKFEADKRKVDRMKQERKFKPQTHWKKNKNIKNLSIYQKSFSDLRMDKLNKLADKLERSAEKLVDKIEDSLENAQDPPVVPMTTGTSIF